MTGVPTLADHAVSYARVGYLIFPVRPTKAPYVSQHHATEDPERIAKWWAEWPDALIGVRFPPDMIGLDIDPRHNGDDVWRAIKATFDIPPTRTYLSGRGDGGGHVWFRRPPGQLSIAGLDAWAKERGLGHQVGARWSCGIDLLTHEHRYSILPPSPHPETGKPYTWHREEPVAEMPAGLAALLTTPITSVTNLPGSTTTREIHDQSSIADWYSANHDLGTLLRRHGWTEIKPDTWRHPEATTESSATVTNGCLFVYSTSTPFEPTAPGDVHGYTPFRAYAVLDHGGDLSTAAREAREEKDGPRPGTSPAPSPPAGFAEPKIEDDALDLRAGMGGEREAEDWLVYPLWPRGRSVALYAAHKTGKSLITLEAAAALASGRAVMGQPAGTPIHIVYIDMEMTQDDVYERLEALGYDAEVDDPIWTHLHYYQHIELPPLDTWQGGAAVMERVVRWGAEAVIVDTVARVVEGPENDADTFKNLSRHTFQPLKAIGVSCLRLDHAGKEATRGQRGSSSKGDDVDVIWRLQETKTAGDYELIRDASRVGWVPKIITVTRQVEPVLKHLTAERTYQAGAGPFADGCEQLGIDPFTTSQKKAKDALKAAGITFSNNAVADGWRAYKERVDRRRTDREMLD